MVSTLWRVRKKSVRSTVRKADMGLKGPETWGRDTRPSEALVTRAQVNAEVNAQHADLVYQGF